MPRVRNGSILRLAPGAPEVIGQAHHGRIYKDGNMIGDITEVGITNRRKLSFAGHVSVNILLDGRNDINRDPEVVAIGLPETDGQDDDMEDILYDAVLGAVESIPRGRRKDLDGVRESIRRAVRAAANEVWGKKPVVTVFVNRV